jgi:hypothetical protein
MSKKLSQASITQAVDNVLVPLDTPQYASNKKRKLSNKQKAFARNYAKTLNATQSALASYETTDIRTAQNIGSENLSKPIVRQEIARLLESNNIELSSILSIHKRNMLQDDHLPTSQKAVSDFYEILGMKSTDKPSNEVKIAFVIEK